MSHIEDNADETAHSHKFILYLFSMFLQKIMTIRYTVLITINFVIYVPEDDIIIKCIVFTTINFTTCYIPAYGTIIWCTVLIIISLLVFRIQTMKKLFFFLGGGGGGGR